MNKKNIAFFLIIGINNYLLNASDPWDNVKKVGSVFSIGLVILAGLLYKKNQELNKEDWKGTSSIVELVTQYESLIINFYNKNINDLEKQNEAKEGRDFEKMVNDKYGASTPDCPVIRFDFFYDYLIKKQALQYRKYKNDFECIKNTDFSNLDARKILFSVSTIFDQRAIYIKNNNNNNNNNNDIFKELCLENNKKYYKSESLLNIIKELKELFIVESDEINSNYVPSIFFKKDSNNYNILLAGPTGSGKTACLEVVFRDAVPDDWQVFSYTIPLSNILTKWVHGEVETIKDIEKKIKNKVDELKKIKNKAVIVINIDEAESLFNKRLSGDLHDVYISDRTNIMLNFMDSLNNYNNLEDIKVILAMTTNHLEKFDSAAIRAGRISKQFNLDHPTKEEKQGYLNFLIDQQEHEVQKEILKYFINSNCEELFLKKMYLEIDELLYAKWYNHTQDDNEVIRKIIEKYQYNKANHNDPIEGSSL